MVRSTQKTSIWTYLLFGAFGLAALAMLLLIVAALVVPRIIDNTIERYTDEMPAQSEGVEIPEREYERLIERVDGFAKAVDAGESEEPLVLSSEEVAALIQNEVQAEINKRSNPPRAQLWLRVEDSRLRGPVSINMDEFATGMFDHLRGRYLNGDAVIDVRHANDQIRVRVESFKIKNEPIPDWIRQGLQDAIDKAVADSSELRDLGRKVGGIEIADDEIIVRSR